MYNVISGDKKMDASPITPFCLNRATMQTNLT